MNKENLYKLPFSKYNNPSGWIEPTTFCQLKCPHCYRGCDRDDHKPEHRSIEEVLKEVDELIRTRNIQILSIMGGEPMLYPDLEKLINYAINKNLKVVVNTNGILIDESNLKRLKNIGVNKVIIHVDKYQNRKNIETEADAQKLRQWYCDLFREVGGISLGFNTPISNDNFTDLDTMIPFLKNNADIINLCIFTILRPVFSDKEFPSELQIDEEKVFTRVKELYGLEYYAYLGKTITDEISWIYSLNIFADNKFLGSVDKDIAKFFQEENFKKEGRYIYQSGKKISPRLFFNLLINRSTRKIILNYITKNRMQGKISEQSLIILNPVKLNEKEFNLCEGCPNAILFKNDLVPSCLLERIKAGEQIKIK